MSNLTERTLHRLEAFSDIVIAFCLAEVGLGLAIPNSPAALQSTWPGLNAFIISFALISIIWWYHHRLFVTCIALNAATVIANFLMLGSLALGVYFQQVTVHFLASGVDPVTPLHAWLGCMAAVVAFLAGMYGVGIWEHRSSLDASAMRWAISVAYQTGVSAIGLAGLCFAFPNNRTAVVAIVIIVGVAASLRNAVARKIKPL